MLRVRNCFLQKLLEMFKNHLTKNDVFNSLYLPVRRVREHAHPHPGVTKLRVGKHRHGKRGALLTSTKRQRRPPYNEEVREPPAPLVQQRLQVDVANVHRAGASLDRGGEYSMVIFFPKYCLVRIFSLSSCLFPLLFAKKKLKSLQE